MYRSHTQNTRQQLGTGVAVAALQLGLGLALVSTFAGGVITAVTRHPLPARDYTYVPPPPPQPDQPVHARQAPDTPSPAPQPQNDDLSLPHELTFDPILPLPLPGGDAIGIPTGAPQPRPTPAMPPVAAHPLGNPGDWITPNDYPSRALREGWSGVTRLHLAIDSNGQVTGCTVTASSGHAALDAVACEKVSQRARFAPARDASGAAREGVYNGAIRWQIHEE
jgi:protein TonB